MASIAQLNVRLGLLYDQFDKSLGQVENKLRRSGERMSRLGSDLTLAVSAPLLALGSAAIKQAANLESLENALASQMGSAEAARKELELLRQEALKPGLGFEQAVKGSVQLQAVGFSAEFARRTLSAFGNALATAGKGKAELDGVSLALTQISAKGKVSAEEINQIAERLPQIRTAMKAAFGTADTEALQKMGISSQQFIEGIVKQLEKIPPASNSLKNNLENAGDSINQFLASIGKEINKAFNLSEKSQQLSEFLQGAAKGFAGLDDSTKRTIIQFGLFALAAGPVIKVWGVMKSTGAQVIATVRGIGDTMRSIGGAVLNAASAFQKLNLVMKVTVVGAAIAAVTALYIAYDHYANSLTDAERAQKANVEAMQDVNKEAALESASLNANIEVLKKVNSTQEERARAIKTLQDKYPEYLGNIDLEKASLSTLESIQNRVNKSILQSVAARKQSMLVDEQFAKIRDATLKMQDIQSRGFDALSGEDVKRTGRSLFGTEFEKGFVMAEARAKTVAEVMQLLKQDIDGANNAVNQINESFKKAFADPVKPWQEEYYKDVEEGTGKIKEQKTGIDALNESYKNLDRTQKLMTRKEQTADLKNFKGTVSPQIDATTTLPDTINSIEDPFAKIAESVRAATVAMSENMTVSSQMATVYAAAREGTEALQAAMGSLAAQYLANGQMMQAAAVSIGDAVAQAGARGASSLKDFAAAALGSAAKVIRAWIQMAVTRAALSALQNIPFPFNIAAAAAAGGLAAGLFNGLIKKVGIPALAEGGVATGPTLAMVGEYAGARSNPEIIAPESKIRNLFRSEMSGMGGGTQNIVAVAKGDDLYFIWQKAHAKSARLR